MKLENSTEIRNTRLDCPVVGVGASAGGLAAISDFLRNLPGNAHVAVVVIQHLAPLHESMLPELIGKASQMPVLEAVDGMVVEADYVYVLPPNKELTIVAGVLQLRPRNEAAPHLPIDRFFRSLAQERKTNAVGIVLSGSGSDGALGLRAIKAGGGITFAQAPQTAQHDGMPAAAITTGCVDFVLTPRDIAVKLVAVAHLPRTLVMATAESQLSNHEFPDNALAKIFMLLRHRTGNDFSQYKRATVERRVRRRMLLSHSENLGDYVRLLEQQPDEVGVLFQDLLISVTEFFRDAAAFATLREKVFAALLTDAERSDKQPIRIWVPGCATGEEVYTVAMVLLETLGELGVTVPVQIFGTDIDALAIEKARQGAYPEGISDEVSPDRLQRFFTKTATGYRVAKGLRGRCVFAPQNVLKDPPFSRLDLICCRNLLIYLNGSLQNRLLEIFHYALNPNGVLFLGTSETTGNAADLFAVIDKKAKLYRKKYIAIRPHYDFHRIGPGTATHTTLERGGVVQAGAQRELHRQIENIILSQFTPPGVVVDENLDIALFLGHTGHYLDPAPGSASLNLMKLARRELVGDLRLVVNQALQSLAPSRRSNVPFEVNGAVTTCTIEAVPLPIGNGGRYFTVIFRAEQPLPAPTDVGGAGSSGDYIRIRELEGELAATKEYMQSIIERHEVTNEELQSANEEIQSANEELQSTNEELETAREELQSTNEELATVNEELGNRNHDLIHTIDDLKNLLSSVNLPIVMLDEHLRVRHFTPSAQKFFNLIDGDVGRPITNIKPNLNLPNLKALVDEVLDSLSPRSIEVCDSGDRWYELRVQPYRTAERKITGCVLVFVDITLLKNTEQLRRLATAARDSNDAITVQDFNGVIQAWNPRAAQIFGYSEAEAIGTQVGMLIPPTRRDEYKERSRTLLQGKNVAALRTQRTTKKGAIINVLLAPSPLTPITGTPHAFTTTEKLIDD